MAAQAQQNLVVWTRVDPSNDAEAQYFLRVGGNELQPSVINGSPQQKRTFDINDPEPSDIAIKGPYTPGTFNTPLLPEVLNAILTQRV
jgi:hypothetical protein